MEIEVVELSGQQKSFQIKMLCWLTAPKLNIDRKRLSGPLADAILPLRGRLRRRMLHP